MTMAAFPLIFGEVLFDRFPDGEATLGGAPFNVAWHLAAFGAAPLLVSRVGRDDNGARVRTAMERCGLSQAGLQDDPIRPTGIVDITMAGGEPAYDIRPGAAWDGIAAAGLPATPDAALIYHGSLALRSRDSADALAALRRACPVPVFLDVNLRDPWWSPETVMPMIAAARWVKLNADEFDRLAPGRGRIAARARAWIDSFGLDLVVVTRGEKGAVAVSAADGVLAPPAVPAAVVVDPVGAGDAFSAVLILGLLRGWDAGTAVTRAISFAAALVGRRGATPDDPGFYRPFAETW